MVDKNNNSRNCHLYWLIDQTEVILYTLWRITLVSNSIIYLIVSTYHYFDFIEYVPNHPEQNFWHIREFSGISVNKTFITQMVKNLLKFNFHRSRLPKRFIGLYIRLKVISKHI